MLKNDHEIRDRNKMSKASTNMYISNGFMSDKTIEYYHVFSRHALLNVSLYYFFTVILFISIASNT